MVTLGRSKFTFNPGNFTIYVADGVTAFSAQELYNDAATWSDEPGNMQFTPPLDASGLFALGGGISSDAIFRVIEPWKIKPADGSYRLTVTGTLITDGGFDVDYETQVSDFTAGETVTGQSSGARGIVLVDTTPGDLADGTLTIVATRGTLTVGEVIAGDVSGEATVVSTPISVVTNPFTDVDSGTVTIIVVAASAGTVAFSDQVNEQSFFGKIWLDTQRGASGTAFPKGTPTDPVKTFADAIAIATSVKLNAFHLEGSLILDVADETEDTDWFGTSPLQSTLVLNGLSNDTNHYERMTVTGVNNGHVTFEYSMAGSITGFDGSMFQCALFGTIVLDPTSDDSHFFDCWSSVGGLDTPVLDFNGAVATSCSLRNYSGGIEIRNFTQGNLSIDMSTGHVKLHSSCTGGTIVVRGVARLTDQSNGSNISLDGLIAHHRSGIITADTTPSTTTVSTDMSETMDNAFKDTFIRFMSGDLVHQIRFITSSSNPGGGHVLTFQAFAQAPAVGDRFVIINS